jgi:sugar-specific transcriptional regulator TrmB
LKEYALFSLFSCLTYKEDLWKLTQEWMIKTLVSLGQSQLDAEIYVFLSTRGPQNWRSIAAALKLHKQQVYRSLKRLQARRIVNSYAERPAIFSSISFEEVLDLFLQVKKQQADALKENREKLLSRWQAITKKDLGN